jgi:hypothetical protein
MNNKEITAIEWFYTKLITGKFTGNDTIEFLYETAKEKEKEQIIETWHNGYENQSPMLDEDNCGEQYYNETYKSE